MWRQAWAACARGARGRVDGLGDAVAPRGAGCRLCAEWPVESRPRLRTPLAPRARAPVSSSSAGAVIRQGRAKLQRWGLERADVQPEKGVQASNSAKKKNSVGADMTFLIL